MVSHHYLSTDLHASLAYPVRYTRKTYSSSKRKKETHTVPLSALYPELGRFVSAFHRLNVKESIIHSCKDTYYQFAQRFFDATKGMFPRSKQTLSHQRHAFFYAILSPFGNPPYLATTVKNFIIYLMMHVCVMDSKRTFVSSSSFSDKREAIDAIVSLLLEQDFMHAFFASLMPKQSRSTLNEPLFNLSPDILSSLHSEFLRRFYNIAAIALERIKQKISPKTLVPDLLSMPYINDHSDQFKDLERIVASTLLDTPLLSTSQHKKFKRFFSQLHFEDLIALNETHINQKFISTPSSTKTSSSQKKKTQKKHDSYSKKPHHAPN